VLQPAKYVISETPASPLEFVPPSLREMKPLVRHCSVDKCYSLVSLGAWSLEPVEVEREPMNVGDPA